MKKSILMTLIAATVTILAGCGTTTTTWITEEENNSTNQEERESTTVIQPEKIDLNNYLWKPTMIVWAGTYCSHCQREVPLIEEKIYNELGSSINLSLKVIDNKRFDINMPQEMGADVYFEDIAWTECGYIPSWIILDGKWKVALQSCGSQKTTNEAKNKLLELLKN